MSLAIYVDDQQVSAMGSSEHVEQVVIGATKELGTIVQTAFKASFAEDKSTHVATAMELASKLRDALCPEGAAGTASDGPRPAAAADVQLRLLAFAGTVDGRLGVQSQIQLCCSSAGPRRSHKSHEFAWQVPHTGRR